MSRVACSLVLLAVVSASARAADLPPGALARLGDDRFRAGGPITHLALSPDGKRFATVDAGTGDLTTMFTLWDATTGRAIHEHPINNDTFERGLFRGMVWGPRGGFAVFIRAEAGQGAKPARVFRDDFRVWAFTDPKTVPPLLPTSEEGDARPLTPPHGVYAEQLKGSGEYFDFRFSADGTHVAALWQASDQKKHAIHVFELKATDTASKLKRVGEIDVGAEGADGFRLSPNGTALVTFRDLANPDAAECTATAWSLESGTPGKPVRVPRSPYHPPALTPDGRFLVVRVRDEKESGFDLVELGTGTRREFSRFRPAPDAGRARGRLADDVIVPSGRVLVRPGSPTVLVDLTNGTELGRLSGHMNHPAAVAVSADGRTIATADTHGLVRLWDAKTLRALDAVPGHRARVEHAQLSPDGKRLLTWAADRTVRLWDIASGKELRAFTGATDDSAPLFSPDGTAVLYHAKNELIARDLQTGLEVPLPKNVEQFEPRAMKRATARVSAEGSHDGGAILRETASGDVRYTLNGHRGEVRVLGFTSDGMKLLTAGGDHTVLVWDMRLQSVPLPDAIKKETNAAKLWDTLATGKAEAAYLAMARLSREPDAALKLLKLKLKPAANGDDETDATNLIDCRAIELLEALGTDESRVLLKELAGGEATAFRTQEAKRALERSGKK